MADTKLDSKVVREEQLSSPLEKKKKPAEESEPEEDEEEDEEKSMHPEDLIDAQTFDQILDMDEEDDHEFSYSLVVNYFEQAESTFKNMDDALRKKDLSELSRLGHFLKGSSAAIGVKKVKESCEKIQHIGNCRDEAGSKDIKEQEALQKIIEILPQVKAEYSEAEQYLKSFYEQEA
ncbi:hypothetical protein VTP01DRAFT_2999 [Rhizomucor pusillus]|uniref:uncharacterized protein n=1 Tax=Rhizomucor pusillus TaxID=4840 RepID=UPI0037445FAD